jgi:hypothetical protein
MEQWPHISKVSRLSAVRAHASAKVASVSKSSMPVDGDRAQAALEWTEAVTRVSETHVPDAVYKQVQKYFSEKEIMDLTIVVSTINMWNRLALSTRSPSSTPALVTSGHRPVAAAPCRLRSVRKSILHQAARGLLGWARQSRPEVAPGARCQMPMGQPARTPWCSAQESPQPRFHYAETEQP